MPVTLTVKQLLEGQFQLVYTVDPGKVCLEGKDFSPGQNFLG